MIITDVVTACIRQIEQSHVAREKAISASRALIRQCANSIRAAHRGEFAEVARLLGEADRLAEVLRQAVADHAELRFAGYTQDGFKEYAEAHLVLAFLAEHPLPSPATLAIEPAAYLNGLAEAASELRRAILDGLRRGETQRGEILLQLMDDVYSELITVDYPDAITGGLRRTTDALRAVLERTRGDMTAAIRQDQLVASMQKFEERLRNAAEPEL